VLYHRVAAARGFFVRKLSGALWLTDQNQKPLTTYSGKVASMQRCNSQRIIRQQSSRRL
jgi:hypothetical protein